MQLNATRRTRFGFAFLGAAVPGLTEAAPDCANPEDCAASLLEEVVVIGRRAPQVVMDASASISVVTAAELARSTASGLADAMRSVPGVQLSDAGQPGLKRIRIRGEESRRTAILVDGQEITDHWEVGTPLSLSPAMVERIEVLRGSGSVLYGSRALSGVVNFITRKGGTRPLQLELSSAFDSSTQGNEQFASVFGNQAGLEYRLAAAAGDHGDRDTPRGEIDNTAYDNQSAYAWAGREFGAHRVELSWDSYESATEVFVEDEVKTTFPLVDFRIDVPQRDREKYALVYQWSEPLPGLERLALNLHHQDNARRFETFSATVLPGPLPLRTDSSIYSDAQLAVDEALLQLDWRPGAAHSLVSGLQYTQERVNQERHVDRLVNGIAARPEDIHDEASITTLAVFAQDEWQIGDRTRLGIGARNYLVEGKLDETSRPGLDEGSRSDSKLIGSLGLTHEIGDDAVLRASAAQGYVYPSLLQLATGAYAGSRFVNPNPELDPETSWSLESGLRLRRAGWVLDTGIFHGNSEDYIDHVFCTPADGCLGSRDKIYVNVGESEATGLEAYAARETGVWRPYSSLTWMKRANRYEGFQTEESGTPALAGTLGVLWSGRFAGARDTWLDLGLHGETGSRREEPSSSGAAVRERDDAWLTLNVSAGASFGNAPRLGVVLALENLADATYSTSAENLFAPGRSVSARFSLALD